MAATWTAVAMAATWLTEVAMAATTYEWGGAHYKGGRISGGDNSGGGNSPDATLTTESLRVITTIGTLQS